MMMMMKRAVSVVLIPVHPSRSRLAPFSRRSVTRCFTLIMACAWLRARSVCYPRHLLPPMSADGDGKSLDLCARDRRQPRGAHREKTRRRTCASTSPRGGSNATKLGTEVSCTRW